MLISSSCGQFLPSYGYNQWVMHTYNQKQNLVFGVFCCYKVLQVSVTHSSVLNTSFIVRVVYNYILANMTLLIHNVSELFFYFWLGK